jgi:hypothetical protein
VKIVAFVNFVFAVGGDDRETLFVEVEHAKAGKRA